MKKFNYKSVMQIPKLEKVVVNVGCGDAKDNAKVIDSVVKDISDITGQKPIVCRAKKSIANFKIRAGMPIGVKVTLRRGIGKLNADGFIIKGESYVNEAYGKSKITLDVDMQAGIGEINLIQK
jgi:hypothetical protein